MVDSAAAKGEEDHHRHDRDTPRHDGAGIGPLGVLDHGRETPGAPIIQNSAMC
jgi:hypothetical protein